MIDKQLRIIHLSDLHLTRDGRHLNNLNAFAIAHHICSRRADGATIVAVTGDCTDNSAREEQQHLIDWLYLMKAYFPVFCVPGNHDYALQGISFLPESVKSFSDIILGPGKGQFPFVEQISGHPVTIIGLDSADPEDTEFLAQGIVGHAQLHFLERQAKAAKDGGRLVVVLLHHHPFARGFGMPLVDSEAFLQVVEAAGVDLVLFGHKHVSAHYPACTMLASGKSTEPDKNGVLSYRIVVTEDRRISGIYIEEFAL